MSIIVVAEIPGGTAEQDDAMLKELNIESDPPQGSRFRVAGPTEGGWRIISVWDSQEAFDTFRRERLEPALKKAGRQPPQINTWPVHTILNFPVG